MKNDHKRAFDLSFGKHTGGTKIWKENGEKEMKQGRQNSAAPFQDIQVILMPFQVFIMSMKCPRSSPK